MQGYPKLCPIVLSHMGSLHNQHVSEHAPPVSYSFLQVGSQMALEG